eukprot:jgi/Tetstr1/462004/TSEL_007075.t1
MHVAHRHTGGASRHGARPAWTIPQYNDFQEFQPAAPVEAQSELPPAYSGATTTTGTGATAGTVGLGGSGQRGGRARRGGGGRGGVGRKASGRGRQPQDRDEATSPPKKMKDAKPPKKPQYVDEDGKPCSKDYYTGHNATWTREDEELMIKLRSYPDTHKKFTVHSDRNLGMWDKVAKDFNSMVPERRRQVGGIERHFGTLWGKYRNWKLLHTTDVSGMPREKKERRIMNKHL